MQRWLSAVLSVVLMGGVAIACSLTTFPVSAQANTCRQYQGHEICLERIQRSAKYHWQYKVRAQLDGQPQPLTRYNCRDRIRTPMAGAEKGNPMAFTPDGIGEMLCKLVNH